MGRLGLCQLLCHGTYTRKLLQGRRQGGRGVRQVSSGVQPQRQRPQHESGGDEEEQVDRAAQRSNRTAEHPPATNPKLRKQDLSNIEEERLEIVEDQRRSGQIRSTHTTNDDKRKMTKSNDSPRKRKAAEISTDGSSRRIVTICKTSIQDKVSFCVGYL